MTLQAFVDKSLPVVSAAFLNYVDVSKNLFTDLGTTNVIVVSTGQNLAVTVDMQLYVRIVHTNTAQNPTLTFDGQTANIINTDGSQVAVGQLTAAGIILFKFDGTNWQIISAGDVDFPDGSAAAPSIAFNNSPGTGFWSPTPNALAWSTSGIQRGSVDQNGAMILLGPTSGTTLTVNNNTTLGQSAITAQANANLYSSGLTIKNNSIGNAAVASWSCFAGTNGNTAIGAFATSPAFAGSLYTAITGPVSGIGMFNNTFWPFIMFMGQEARLLFPTGNGGGVQCYGPSAGSFVDMTCDNGTFSASVVGFSSTVTPTFTWERTGSWVTLWVSGGFVGNSGGGSATSMTVTVPAAIRPSAGIGAQYTDVYYGLIDNGITQLGLAAIAPNGLLTFLRLTVSGSVMVGGSNFTGSGNKGLAPQTIFSWRLF